MMRGIAAVLMLVVGFGCSDGEGVKERAAAPEVAVEKPVKRVGMVVGIKADRIDRYKELHADSYPGVRDLLSKYHMRNFSIYLEQIGDQWYEFGYYEYAGDDYDGDMARLGREPRNIAWLEMCNPMQVPLPGQEGWKVMERVYFNP